MGGILWSYFTPFESSVRAALQTLQERVFASGNFRGSESKPASPFEALQQTMPEGTASILDIMSVSTSPGICIVRPVEDEELEALFGTTRPTREMIEANLKLYDGIERGQGICTIAYQNDVPSEYFFAGYSFD